MSEDVASTGEQQEKLPNLSKNGKPLGRPKGVPELARKPGKAFNTERKRKFLKALAETGSVSDACAAVGVTRMTAYNHRQKHKAFAERWEMALNKATASFEKIYHDRVREGDEVVEYDGEGNVVKRTIKKAAKPVEGVLKTLDPERYSPNSRSEVNVNINNGESAVTKLAELLKIKLPESNEEKVIEGESKRTEWEDD